MKNITGLASGNRMDALSSMLFAGISNSRSETNASESSGRLSLLVESIRRLEHRLIDFRVHIFAFTIEARYFFFNCHACIALRLKFFALTPIVPPWPPGPKSYQNHVH
jgi:hypothetical protein